jgi:hypothetical protein
MFEDPAVFKHWTGQRFSFDEIVVTNEKNKNVTEITTKQMKTGEKPTPETSLITNVSQTIT